jgi:hypothetical protein
VCIRISDSLRQLSRDKPLTKTNLTDCCRQAAVTSQGRKSSSAASQLRLRRSRHPRLFPAHLRSRAQRDESSLRSPTRCGLFHDFRSPSCGLRGTLPFCCPFRARRRDGRTQQADFSGQVSQSVIGHRRSRSSKRHRCVWCGVWTRRTAVWLNPLVVRRCFPLTVPPSRRTIAADNGLIRAVEGEKGLIRENEGSVNPATTLVFPIVRVGSW